MFPYLTHLKPIPIVLVLQAAMCSPLWAADTHIASDTVNSASQTLSKNGDALTVDSKGGLSVNNDSPAVVVTAPSGTATIHNNGIIEQTGSGRTIDISKKDSTVITTINNGLNASITALNNDVIRLDKKTQTLQVVNDGTIWQKNAGGLLEGGQAIDMKDVTSSGNSIINGSVTNTSALIRADGDDAIRPASNTTIINYGTILSNGIVNTGCPDYLAEQCKNSAGASKGKAPGASDGIDTKDATNVVIDNYGTISGPRHGITANADIIVTNEINGQIIGHNGSGIGSDGTGTVVNHGLISGRYAGEGKAYDHFAGTQYAGIYTTSSNGDGDGVDIDGIADVTNYGRIEGLGGGGFDSGQRPNGGDGIAAGGGRVVNMQGASIWGDSNGILIDDGANGTEVSVGRGTSTAAPSVMSIVNSGEIIGNKKVGIGLVGNYNDVIINNDTGRIIGGKDTVRVDELNSTTPAAAIQMGAGDDLLENHGYIEGKNGLAIDMGDGNDTLKLLGGTVIGTIDGGTGVNTLVTGGNQFFKEHTLTNFQNFIVSSGLTTVDYSLGTVNQVRIDNGASLRLNGDVNANNLTVNGTLLASSKQDLRQITVNGDYTQSATGVLEARIAAAGKSDQMSVLGNTTISDGATIRPVAKGYIEGQQTYTLISSASQNNNISANPDQIVIDNTSKYITYTLQNVGNSLQLVANRTKTLSSVVDNNHVTVTNNLKYVFNSSDAGANLMNALEALPTAQAVNKATDQLAPETNAKSQSAAFMSQNAVFSAIGAHISEMRNSGGITNMADSGLSGGDEIGHRFWVKGLAAWGNQKAFKNNNGYSENLQGFALGRETDINATDIVGFSGGYSQVSIDGTDEGSGDGNKVKSGHAGVYFSRTNKDYTLDASVIASFNRYNSQRTVLISGFTESLTGKYSGQQLGMQVEYGIPFGGQTNWNGRWIVGTALGYLTNGAYSESGGVSAQHVDRSHSNSAKSILGVEINKKISDYALASVHARYFHEFADPATVNASFIAGGQSFSMDGVQAGRESVQLGAGYQYITQRGLILNVGYDVDIKDRYFGHQISVKTSWNF